MITGPCSWNTTPPFSYVQPTTAPCLFVRKLVALALVMIRALSVFSASSGFLAPPFKVSEMKSSVVSGMPFAFCVFVSAPLIPLVALVEFPPQKADLSSRTTLAPFSSRVLAADTPERPPPRTMPWSHGKTQAILSYKCVSSKRRQKPNKNVITTDQPWQGLCASK